MSRSERESQNVELPSFIKEGPVRKAGFLVLHLTDHSTSNKQSTQKYYFVLKTNLYYYENQHAYESGGSEIGIIYLNSYFCEKSSSAQDFLFTIYAYPKTVTLQAGSDGELKDWMKILLNVPDYTLNTKYS